MISCAMEAVLVSTIGTALNGLYEYASYLYELIALAPKIAKSSHPKKIWRCHNMGITKKRFAKTYARSLG
jgi:hypothetical protein